MSAGLPPKQGLYDPQFEHDSCGVGFVVDVHGRKSNDIVRKALQVLINMLHRGAKGSESNTGDGAGILIQIPHQFLQDECAKAGIELPEEDERSECKRDSAQPSSKYGVGMVCLPRKPESRRRCEDLFAGAIEQTGQRLLGWRDVPTNNEPIGASAKAVEPMFRQVFIACGENGTDDDFERRLFLIRKRVEKAVRNSDILDRSHFYLSSLSARTIIYK